MVFYITFYSFTFRIFFKWSTEISPLENFLLAYAAKVDCSSYIITPRSLEIPKMISNKIDIATMWCLSVVKNRGALVRIYVSIPGEIVLATPRISIQSFCLYTRSFSFNSLRLVACWPIIWLRANLTSIWNRIVLKFSFRFGTNNGWEYN